MKDFAVHNESGAGVWFPGLGSRLQTPAEISRGETSMAGTKKAKWQSHKMIQAYLGPQNA
jgi:hypothetical protein